MVKQCLGATRWEKAHSNDRSARGRHALEHLARGIHAIRMALDPFALANEQLRYNLQQAGRIDRKIQPAPISGNISIMQDYGAFN